MSQGDIMILHGKVHGFLNTTIVWYDRPFEPEICFRQFPTRDAVVMFADANELRVVEETPPEILIDPDDAEPNNPN